MIYLCCDERRRNAVRAHAILNGIDFLEVLDREAPPGSPRQRTLVLRLLKPVAALTAENVLIQGGERITPVNVEWVADASAIPPGLVTVEEEAFFSALPDPQNVLLMRTDSAGDYSPYILRLVTSATNLSPPADVDPLLARVDFSFKVECPSDFDCAPVRACAADVSPEPDINYLAKDYGSFRRIMLDRMAQLMPDWRERSPADLGQTLVELLAYVGDHLSYRQDAVATEAYLHTARRRTSVRRHARLVDYAMHDGCNARAWVQVQVEIDGISLPEHTKLLTRIPRQPARIPTPATASIYDEAMRQNPMVFETMKEVTLFAAHNELPFYSWGDNQCCLPAGATRATLRGHHPTLLPDYVLIFEEVVGPLTGVAEDADPLHRHAVRLAEVVTEDAGGDPLVDSLTGGEITEIRWRSADALPFPLCISSRTDEEHGSSLLADVSVARGNIVLADHGLTLAGEPLGTVPEPTLFRSPEVSVDRCAPRQRLAVPPRFNPALSSAPLTQATSYDGAAPAVDALAQSPADARPALSLQSLFNGEPASWEPRRDLLASAPDATEFVAEVESDGTARLRFGDDARGMRPQSGTSFTATYRVGNGAAGNLGPESLAHVVTDEVGIVAVRNPLAARGGTDAESLESVRTRAPHAFRVQERAVTPADYEEVSLRRAGVQRAAATFRWTGSWHTVFVTVDRAQGLVVDAGFEAGMRGHLERYRMAGYDLEIDAPRFVPLEIDMQVCVKPDYFRSDVKRALLELFSSTVRPDGRRGLFHPDNFTFAQAVYLSALYAAAQSVPGVDSATITKFQRQGIADPRPLENGRLNLGRLEIARLDNDRSFPEHGVFRLQLGGGK